VVSFGATTPSGGAVGLVVASLLQAETHSEHLRESTGFCCWLVEKQATGLSNPHKAHVEKHPMPLAAASLCLLQGPGQWALQCWNAQAWAAADAQPACMQPCERFGCDTVVVVDNVAEPSPGALLCGNMALLAARVWFVSGTRCGMRMGVSVGGAGV